LKKKNNSWQIGNKKKFFYKKTRIKIKNQKNKDQSWNNKKKNQPVIYGGGERKKGGKKAHWRWTVHPIKGKADY